MWEYDVEFLIQNQCLQIFIATIGKGFNIMSVFGVVCSLYLDNYQSSWIYISRVSIKLDIY